MMLLCTHVDVFYHMIQEPLGYLSKEVENYVHARTYTLMFKTTYLIIS